MDNRTNYHDIFKIFSRMQLLYGRYDGEKVIVDKSKRFRSHVFFGVLVLSWVKYTALLAFNTRYPMSFWLAHMANFENVNAQKYVIAICSIYIGWEVMMHFCCLRLNRNGKNNYWFRLIPHPRNVSLTAKNVVGTTEQELTKLRNRFDSTGRWTFRGIIVISICMFLLMNSSYLYGFYFRKDNLDYFWTIFIFNSFHLGFILTHAYFVTIAPSMAYTYLSRLQTIRFRSICRSLELLNSQNRLVPTISVFSKSPSSHSNQPRSQAPLYHEIHKKLRTFNLIVADMLRLNHFWSRYFGWNFFFAMFLLFFFVLEVTYGEMWQLRVAFATLTVFVYIICLLIPTYYSSQVQSEVGSQLSL